VLVERNVGEKAHAFLQLALGAYLHRRRKQWNIRVYTELRVKVREAWYPLPDVCVYETDFEGHYPSIPPLLWVEILSPDDRMPEVWKRVSELLANGVPYIWIIEPHSLESELWTANGVSKLADKTLRLPNSPIVIPLAGVMEE
jgi:Uma2 family endonuclease